MSKDRSSTKWHILGNANTGHFNFSRSFSLTSQTVLEIWLLSQKILNAMMNFTRSSKRWCGGATVRHLGLRSVGRGFKSCSRQRCITTLGKLFIPMCSVTKQYNLVPAKGWWCSVAGEVTAGLAESNGSLPPGGWLTVTYRLTASTVYTGISSGSNARYRVWEAFTFYLVRCMHQQWCRTPSCIYITNFSNISTVFPQMRACLFSQSDGWRRKLS